MLKLQYHPYFFSLYIPWIFLEQKLIFHGYFRTITHFLRENITFDDAVNTIHDIKKALKTRRSTNLNELEINVKHCQEQIAVDWCEGLRKSMPRRVQAVLAANGGYTKF